jgi:hypothetical protein
MSDGPTIRDLISTDYMRAENVIRRARAAQPALSHEALGNLVAYPTSLVWKVLGEESAGDDDATPVPRLRNGARKMLAPVSPAGCVIEPWEAASFERAEKRKAAQAAHYTWLIKKGIKPVSPQEDTPPTRTRAAGWREHGTV